MRAFISVKLVCWSCLVSLLLFLHFLILPLDKASAMQSEESPAKLAEGAKKEGKLVWYTTMTADEANKLGERFREKHPFIAVEFVKLSQEKLLQRIFAEHQMKKNLFDVAAFAQTGILLKRQGILGKYLSPEMKFFPEGFTDPEGYWTDLYVTLNVIGYNTKLVSSQQAPKVWADLLNPRWKGNIGMDSDGFQWLAGMMTVMGEEKGLQFMKKLSEQNIQVRSGRTLNAQLVVAGELNCAVVYNNRVEEMKEKGAPIDWVGLDPVIPEIHPTGISANAPHPNAAKLFIDFVLSREGQGVIASFHRIPSRIDVDPIIPRLKKGLKIATPFFIGDYAKYTKLYRDLFMKK